MAKSLLGFGIFCAWLNLILSSQYHFRLFGQSSQFIEESSVKSLDKADQISVENVQFAKQPISLIIVKSSSL